MKYCCGNPITITIPVTGNKYALVHDQHSQDQQAPHRLDFDHHHHPVAAPAAGVYLPEHLVPEPYLDRNLPVLV